MQLKIRNSTHKVSEVIFSGNLSLGSFHITLRYTVHIKD